MSGGKFYVFIYVGNSIRTFASNTAIVGTAQIAKAYFNQARNTLAVGIQTYEQNVSSYYRQFATSCITYVSKLGYTLIITTNAAEDNHTWIDGFETLPVSEDNTSSLGAALKPIFEDIMSLLGVPTSTVNALLSGLSSNMALNISLAQHYDLDINFSIVDCAMLADSDVGLPVVYQLDRNATGYNGHSEFTFSTDVTYVTVAYMPGSQTPTIFYTTAGTTNRTFYETLG